MSGPRVVVVGAGAAGLATALHAARLGARSVVVLEREHPASGSSGRAAGIFNRQTPTWPEQALRCESVAALADLERAGLQLRRSGYVRVARRVGDLERMAVALGRERELGVDDARLLDRDGLQELVPDLRCDDLLGGLYCPSDGHLDGHELCGAYAALARDAGVELRLRCALEGAAVGPDGVRLRTGAGALACDVVVNAAGPWAAHVGDVLGAPVALDNQRHEICVAHLEAPLPYALPVVNTYVPDSGDFSLYLCPEAPGRVLCGLHSHAAVEGHGVADPDAYAAGVAHETLEGLAGELLDRLPAWRTARLEPGWAGLYPVSPDGAFQVGPHPSAPHVVAVAGLGGVGLTVSAAVGRLAAEWAVLGEAPSFAFADALLPERPSLATSGAGS